MKPLSSSEYQTIDLSDPDSLLAYAKKLEGHSFREVLDLGIAPKGVERSYNNKRYKGGMGTLIEERYFGYKANNDDAPDFPDAGVELKATCYDVKRDGTLSAGERLVLTMIPFDKPIEDDILESHLWTKAGKILLIYYRRDKDIDGYDQVISQVALFTPPEKDMAIIEEDYRVIRDLIQAGQAENLSESLTRYLGACTKGSTAKDSIKVQFYPPHAEAKGRAFCFKRQYMDYVLNHYLLGDEGDAECIIKDPATVRAVGFEEYVLSLLEPFVGKTDREICGELGLPYTGNKAQWTSIVYAALGLHGEHAEEFEKANISVRTVRVEADGGVKESLSLHNIVFLDLLEEDWDSAPLHEYFETTRFLFVAFKRGSDGVLRLGGAKFWAMPTADMEGPLKDCWETTRSVVYEGVDLVPHVGRSGKVSFRNNLPSMSDNPVAHVRPHAKKSAYLLSDGTEIGDVRRDGDELPDGRIMTKQSFWLNSSYIETIVTDI